MYSQYAGIIYSSLLSASTHLKVFVYRIGRQVESFLHSQAEWFDLASNTAQCACFYE